MRRTIGAAALAAFALSGAALADDRAVGLAPDLPSVTVDTPQGPVVIERIQDPAHEVTGEWARTSRECPPFCIQPIEPAPGVKTIGELELIAALQDPDVVVIDSRTRDWFEGGTIPGAVNVPYLEAVERMAELGCEIGFDEWDCTGATRIALFCNGLWCGQSPTAIRWMIDAGYPAERISYYRGGMQSWRVLGLTVTSPDD
ncbi:MAG: rhodanese-like domain-containing protein [Paracoccaceae bacterium]|jgi:rhodanese-related sulfurtransferase|nr:rhodanese-like domain-containing protein [Paracoccaceae bacterium]